MTNNRLRSGVLLAMIVATVYGCAVLFGGVAYGVFDYLSYDDIAASSRLSQSKSLLLHLLEFIIPSLGMYLSVMVLLVWWHCSLTPAQSPVEQVIPQRLTDQDAGPIR